MRAYVQAAVVWVGGLLWAAAGLAQTGGNPEKPAPKPALPNTSALPEIGGVVTNQTLTPFGHWFHANFTQAWSAHVDIEGYQLVIKERMLPRGGSEVQIFSADTMVYRAVLPRNLVQIAALSEAAVDPTHQNAVEQGLQALLFRDPDMNTSGL